MLFGVTNAGGQGMHSHTCTPDKLFGVTNAGGQGMHSDTCTPTSSLGLRMHGVRGCTPTRALRPALWGYECKGSGDAFRHVHSDQLFGVTNAWGQGMHSDTCTPTSSLGLRMQGVRGCTPTRALRPALWVTNAAGQGMHSDTCTPTSSLVLRMQ